MRREKIHEYVDYIDDEVNKAFVLGEADALVEHAVHLPFELSHGPVGAHALELVEGSLERIVDPGQLEEFGGSMK